MTGFAPHAKLAVVGIVCTMAGYASGAHRRRVLAPGCLLLVAAFALDLFMCAVQRVLCAFGVVEIPYRPCTGVMATFAALSKLELVFVFLLVAGIAVPWRFPEEGVLVAVLADDGNVFSGQRKPAQVMVELVDLPGAVAMALFALLSLLTFMLVILFVTAVAVQRRVAIAFQILVAAAALQFCLSMCIAKLKLGGVMVKTACGCLPVSLGVAIRAGLSQSALVLVFLLVAAVAVLGRLLEHRTFVAVFAISLHVLAQ